MIIIFPSEFIRPIPSTSEYQSLIANLSEEYWKYKGYHTFPEELKGNNNYRYSTSFTVKLGFIKINFRIEVGEKFSEIHSNKIE